MLQTEKTVMNSVCFSNMSTNLLMFALRRWRVITGSGSGARANPPEGFDLLKIRAISQKVRAQKFRQFLTKFMKL